MTLTIPAVEQLPGACSLADASGAFDCVLTSWWYGEPYEARVDGVIDQEAGTLTLDDTRDHAEADELDCGWQVQARWTGELGGHAFLAPPVLY